MAEQHAEQPIDQELPIAAELYVRNHEHRAVAEKPMNRHVRGHRSDEQRAETLHGDGAEHYLRDEQRTGARAL